MEILNIIDDHSRLALGCDARSAVTGEDVLSGFRRAFRRYGDPRPGAPTAARSSPANPPRDGRIALEIELGHRLGGDWIPERAMACAGRGE